MEEILFKLVSEFIFGAVAVYLIITNRIDSKERENKLMDYQRDLQGKLTKTMTIQKEILTMLKTLKQSDTSTVARQVERQSAIQAERQKEMQP